jgi:hypothetical protein
MCAEKCAVFSHARTRAKDLLATRVVTTGMVCTQVRTDPSRELRTFGIGGVNVYAPAPRNRSGRKFPTPSK